MNGIRILAAALSFASIASGAGAEDSDRLAWIAGLEPGWQFIAAGGPPWSASFARPNFVLGPDGHRIVWARVEFKEPRPALSGAIRIEVDCGTLQSRTLESVYYSGRGLKGRLIKRSVATERWLPSPNDADQFERYVCADTPAQRQRALRGYGTPDWIRRPSADDVAKVYPAFARSKGVEGRVSLDCGLLQGGSLTDCGLISEDPEGLGFGEAALALAKQFRARPSPISGTTRVTIPISFRLPKEP